MKVKGITIDIDPTGTSIVVANTEGLDTAFVDFTKSDEYLDWLEEAHAGDVDFPYTEPLTIEGKEYNLIIYRVAIDKLKRIGEEVEFDPKSGVLPL
jgi:hypothetical protein